jgi:hypothetical protein
MYIVNVMKKMVVIFILDKEKAKRVYIVVKQKII